MTSPTPPWVVRWPVMYQTWSWIAFLHWSYDPRVLQRLLPDRLQVHTFEGRAWVGVTPFFLEDLRTPLAPALPWFTSFPETNVRTYVVGPDGREGLWFFSLDAARLEPVLVARSTYALPYVVGDDGGTRRGGHALPQPPALAWPDPGDLGHHRGRPAAPRGAGPLRPLLTARWQLYTTLGPLLARSTV